MTIVNFFSGVKRALTHPASILVGPVLGIIGKIMAPDLLILLKPLQGLYISFCNIAIVPSIFASMALSITQIMIAPKKMFHLRRMVVVFFGLSALISVFSFLLASALQLGRFLVRSPQIQSMVVQNFQVQTGGFETVLNKKVVGGFTEFLINSIPGNVLQALTTGVITQVVSSALLLGFAIYAMGKADRTKIINLMTVLNKPFDIMVGWSYLFLPVGLFLSTALGLENIKDFGIFKGILFMLIVCLGFFVLGSILALWFSAWRLRVGFWWLIKQFRPSLVLAFTVSEFAPIASASRIIGVCPNIDKNYFIFSFPLGLSLFGFAEMFYYNILMMTMLEIYQIKVSWLTYVVLAISSFFAALPRDTLDNAAPAMFSSIKLPTGFALMLFPAVDWILDPFRNVMNFCVNCACAIYVAGTSTSPSKSPSADTFTNQAQGNGAPVLAHHGLAQNLPDGDQQA
jgi:Na+/H+-dicarboxylate symporter